MIYLILGGVLLAVIGLTVLLARAAGRESAKAEAAQQGLDRAEKANIARSDPSVIERMRTRFRRGV